MKIYKITGEHRRFRQAGKEDALKGPVIG